MGNTSSAVKKKYNDKVYDNILLVVKKGNKDIIKAYATSQGKSVNGLINKLLANEIDNLKV